MLWVVVSGRLLMSLLVPDDGMTNGGDIRLVLDGGIFWWWEQMLERHAAIVMAECGSGDCGNHCETRV